MRKAAENGAVICHSLVDPLIRTTVEQEARRLGVASVDVLGAHDDGIRLDDLGKADVVLVGASRTSKSVTCFYLASHGVRAANVPLIYLHHPPPGN